MITREEEIDAMAHCYTDNIPEITELFTKSDMYSAYVVGAMWADKHPDLSQLWHDAYKEPEIGSNIIVVDKYGQWWEIQPYDGEYDGYGGLTGWECCVAHYNNIQRWAYIDDLLPKTK